MKLSSFNLVIIFSLVVNFLGTNLSAYSKANDSIPSCSSQGQVSCPQKEQASCPDGSTPSCLFVGTQHHPVCQVKSKKEKVYAYKMNVASCQRSK